LGRSRESHFPLADVAIGIAGARNLALKSAWMLEHEPDSRPELPCMAYAYAGDVAAQGTSISAHMQGGQGVSIESAAAMYFVRATGWAVLGGDRLADYQTIARQITEPVEAPGGHRWIFSLVELTDAQQAFLSDLSLFLDGNLTPGVYERQRLSGDNFDEEFHRALGSKGWIMPRWRVAEGGAALDAVCARLLELELERREAPRATLPMLRLVWPAVEQHARPDLARELKPQVANGSVRFCLGYTEPDGGSDIAAAKVRAVPDGDDWIVNGSKVFTSNAQSAQYTFLITRTDPAAPKHKGLTMFLAPLDIPGIEIRGLEMLGNTRTNVVYFDDARVPDRYRIGAVNGGWSVLHGPLDAEHVGGGAVSGLDDLSVGGAYMRYLQRSLDATVRWARESISSDGTRRIDDPVLLAQLGVLATQFEAALCTPGPFGA
jgi:alkylation response protein AidB-like acyl-CoA dehydrogenase